MYLRCGIRSEGKKVSPLSGKERYLRKAHFSGDSCDGGARAGVVTAEGTLVAVEELELSRSRA